MDIQAKSDEVITPEYLDWYSKLTDLPTTISDKLQNIDNHFLRDCIIKISKFPEEKDVIIETVQKQFPFLKYTKSNAWYQDEYGVTGAVSSLPETQVRVPNKISNSPIHPTKICLYQYAIENDLDPEKFSVITKAEKDRWTMKCFRKDLERDIHFYRGGIKRKEDPRKYCECLTNRERLVGEELLHCSILKNDLSTA
ncbi:1553_t:CDS:2 [Ambispora gerdemannii]|uniref:1553_t:CDS:1 n=1 Tax=Ambispora gerdemannii TaxID=144530 RepID=A0A9N9GXJ3_9GLOM|nr:1553_t:CDS:2 [Ambispora gerdemannii]